VPAVVVYLVALSATDYLALNVWMMVSNELDVGGSGRGLILYRYLEGLRITVALLVLKVVYSIIYHVRHSDAGSAINFVLENINKK
jgi:hypothetical protein